LARDEAGWDYCYNTQGTEGIDVEDAKYLYRRDKAREAGLLWGSYHFAGLEGSDGVRQADHYIGFVRPRDDEFICFDCEKHGTFENMRLFVERVRQRLGRYPAIYGRRLLRTLMHGNGESIVTRGILWYDEYPPPTYNLPRQSLPEGWDDWTLWQYTDGRSGPQPQVTPGAGRVDRSVFKGSSEALISAWPFARD